MKTLHMIWILEIFCYLKLCCLGVGDMNRSGFCDLLPNSICYIFLRTLANEILNKKKVMI